MPVGANFVHFKLCALGPAVQSSPQQIQQTIRRIGAKQSLPMPFTQMATHAKPNWMERPQQAAQRGMDERPEFVGPGTEPVTISPTGVTKLDGKGVAARRVCLRWTNASAG
eukprot:GGOE01048752.1.p4 GENE.GGOE01048752.1~~GGOE01048752.1.p4  ORF type:complete len:111 (+),score=0.49 GGOE01048752.1:60-392(+)